MKTMAWTAVVAVLAAGCGSSGGGRSGAGGETPAPGDTQQPGGGPGPVQLEPEPVVDDGRPCRGQVEIRVRGTGVAGFDAFDVQFGALSVATPGGAAAPVRLRPSAPADLVQDNAPLLGTVSVPAGADALVATLPVASVEVSAGGARQPLDACTPPLRFAFGLDQVHPVRCRAVVHVDLGASAVADGGAMAFLPRFSIHF